MPSIFTPRADDYAYGIPLAIANLSPSNANASVAECILFRVVHAPRLPISCLAKRAIGARPEQTLNALAKLAKRGLRREGRAAAR